MEKKIALVTGGSRGIGAAVVKGLAEDGYYVIYTYRDAKHVPLKTESIRGMLVDMADCESITTWAKAMVSEFGKISVVINNAGVWAETQLGKGMLEDFNYQVDVNMRAPWWLMQQLAPYIIDEGSVVNIGSISAERGSLWNDVYCATKAGLSVMSKSWAKALAPRQITVTCIQPAAIDTDMNPYEPGDENEFPIKRYGRVTDVADMVRYLVSDKARFITGVDITLDGGKLA